MKAAILIWPDEDSDLIKVIAMPDFENLRTIEKLLWLRGFRPLKENSAFKWHRNDLNQTYCFMKGKE